MYRISSFAVLLGGAALSLAATPIPNIIPFGVDGALDDCSAPGPDHNSGGTVSVNGHSIEVPKNLIVQFPVAWVPFKQLCEEGMAGGYEVSVSGNFVNGVPIAAQINVGANFFVTGAQGYIEAISFDPPSLKIRGGPTIKINDPNAVFSKGIKQRELFLVDDENPSITAFSGFPMCIPRSDDDPKCPSSNRPAGRTNFQAPDPLVMAPFLVGDFIEYSGLKSGGDILAYAITAVNVQITTVASDTVPNYIRMEDALVGVFDGAANVEIAPYRFIGYLSSCSGASVSISAIDVDPCTGEESYRQIGTAVPKAGDARCKWEFRADTVASSIFTREYLIKANNPVIETKNGIQAGQYIQPVTEWIQGEVDVPGSEPVPYRFSNIRGLVQGDFLDGKQYGPLSPFPGPAPPAPSKICSPDDIPNTTAVPSSTATPTGEPDTPVEVPAPVATIPALASAQRVGAQVILSASNTVKDIPAADLVYAWSKTSPSPSPAVSIQNAASPTCTFTAPVVTKDTNITFSVLISRKSNSTIFSRANVTVLVKPAPYEDVVTLDTYLWESKQSGTITVTCHSNVVNGDNKGMDLKYNNGGTTVKMIKGDGNGKWLYTARSTKRPTNVQCVSDLKGKSAVVTATTARRRRGLFGGVDKGRTWS